MKFERIKEIFQDETSQKTKWIKSIPPVGKHEKKFFNKKIDKFRGALAIAVLGTAIVLPVLAVKNIINDGESNTDQEDTPQINYDGTTFVDTDDIPFIPGQFGKITTSRGICYLPNMVGDLLQTELLLDELEEEGFGGVNFDGNLDGLIDGKPIIYDDFKLAVSNKQARGKSEGTYPNSSDIDGIAGPQTCGTLDIPYFFPNS